jgi:NADH-quinone oxidoreductase subunit J
MTTRPRTIDLGRRLVPGLAAVGLFVVMAAAFLTSQFGESAGFGEGSITAAIGYALFNIQADVIPAETELFLVSFEIIDVVLVAALVGAVMLAKREEEGLRSAVADGGRRLVGRDDDDEGGDA